MMPEVGKEVSVQGSIDDVRVVNDSDGWGFGKLYSPAQGSVSFTGVVNECYEGAKATIKGSWVEHPRFGWQIKAKLVVLEVPETGHGARAWLAHRFDDIGPVLAARIVSAFPPPELWRVLEEEPQRLLEVEGVGEVRLERICSAYVTWAAEREQFEQLAMLGLTPAQIRKAVDRWRTAAHETIAANPYVLQDLPGIGWRQADQIARKQGIGRHDPRRLGAGLVEALRIREREGDTCCTSKGLRATAAGVEILGVSVLVLRERWAEASEASGLVEVDDHWYRPTMAAAEQRVAGTVRALLAPEVE